MKKNTLFIFILFVCAISLQAQITQKEADIKVTEHLSGIAIPFTLYAHEDVQTGFEVLTSTGEKLKLAYSCWVYYVNFTEETNGKYLIVKESNGNILEANVKND
ncbi:MAG: hypothetical protein LBU83_11015, partial [Bacteroidales bacterium]|nr:hypothetical protein [Bacteroidales bacterium]